MRSLGCFLVSALMLVAITVDGAHAKVAFGAWNAAQRLPIIGTQYSIAVPSYFRASFSDTGVLEDLDHGAFIYALHVDVYEQTFVNEALIDPVAGFWLSLWNFFGKSVRVVHSGERALLILTRLVDDVPQPYTLWSVIPLDTPDMAIHVIQVVREDAVFDQGAITLAAKTMRVSKPYATRDGAFIFGLFLPAIAPFRYSAISASGDGAELSALVPGTDGFTVSLRRPWTNDLRDSYDRDRGLEQAMARALHDLDATQEGARQPASFRGLLALRGRFTKPAVAAATAIGYIQYVARTPGCEFSFVGTGLDRDMTDDIAWTIDRIARAGRPQTSLELLGH